MLRKKYSKLALVFSILSLSYPTDGAASLKQRPPRGEQDEESSLTIQLPQHSQANVDMPRQQSRFQIKRPARMDLISEKIKALNDNKVSSTKRGGRPMYLPGTSSFFQGGFALLAMGTFVLTEHGYKEIKELAMGSISALMLVWLPTWLLQGSLVEVLSLASLFSQPLIRRVFWNEFLPRAGSTLKKLFLTEIWRQIWIVALAPLPKPLLAPTDQDIMRIRWLPHWMKEGFLVFRDKIDNFVLASFKNSVKKTMQESVGIFYDDISVSTEVDRTSVSEDSNGIPAVDDLIDDEGPQMICDGDTCWLE